MEQERRDPIFSIDIQIRFRGALYEFRLANLLKWAVGLIVVAARIYRHLHGPAS